MPLSPSEAADALKDLDATERRSSNAYGYHMASPHLILWGFIWLVGYGGLYLDRDWMVWRYLWPALSTAGMAGSFFIGWRMKGARRGAGFGWQYAASAVAVAAFVTALFAILPPTRDAQVAAFFPLLVSLAYVLMGIWASALRMTVMGLVIGALTLYGFFYLPAYYLPWLAIVGGGSLILGGLWMRTV
jgi:hypothetical protein